MRLALQALEAAAPAGLLRATLGALSPALREPYGHAASPVAAALLRLEAPVDADPPPVPAAAGGGGEVQRGQEKQGIGALDSWGHAVGGEADASELLRGLDAAALLRLASRFGLGWAAPLQLLAWVAAAAGHGGLSLLQEQAVSAARLALQRALWAPAWRARATLLLFFSVTSRCSLPSTLGSRVSPSGLPGPPWLGLCAHPRASLARSRCSLSAPSGCRVERRSRWSWR